MKILIIFISVISMSCGRVKESVSLRIDEEFYLPVTIFLKKGSPLKLPEYSSAYVIGCDYMDGGFLLCNSDGVFYGEMIYYGSVRRSMKVIVFP